jgi:hypothetical protein
MGARLPPAPAASPDPNDLLDSYVDSQAPATVAGMRRDLALWIKGEVDASGRRRRPARKPAGAIRRTGRGRAARPVRPVRQALLAPELFAEEPVDEQMVAA